MSLNEYVVGELTFYALSNYITNEDFDFIRCYNSFERRWKIFIKTNKENEFLAVEFDKSEYFKGFHLTCGIYGNMCSLLLEATLSCGKYSEVFHYTGTKVCNLPSETE